MLNLSTLKTPGVYIDEVSLLPPSVAGVETGIPAFIGYTEKSKATATAAQAPARISDLREYEAAFGGPQPENDGLSLQVIDHTDNAGNVLRTEIPVPAMSETARSKHNMYYAVSLYFANGGGPCYIISIGAYSADGQVLAASAYTRGLTALANEDEPTLIVIPEAVNLDDGDYFATYQAALDQAARLQDRFVIIDVKQTLTNTNVLTDIGAFRNHAASFANNRRYGAAYYPYLNTTIDYRFVSPETGINVVRKKVAPDGTDVANSTTTAPLDTFKSSDNLLYQQLKNVLTQVSLTMPPSPAIAGIYAQTDATRGVWKAPANVGVVAINGPAVKIDDEKQGQMNVDPTAGKSVNAIRTLTGRGTLVWGARTLDGNDNEWRYINVRRFFNFVEESVKKATYRFVFEPNDANTWVSVRAMIENFLTLQWRAGALQGAKPEQAFFVRVGLGQTMTADDILNGRLIVEIGMAVVRPAEFIVLRFMHKLPE
ncbi:MAG: phage tail sheath family protein [Lewinellaceae bacterium]|nr:phage tail sheath family protein [Lewinellaceae bacterium]